MTLKIEVLVDQKDLLFSAGDYTTPDTSNRTATFTSDGTQNMLLVGVEIF